MNLSAWAIHRPLPAILIFFVLCVAGLWGFHQLPVARFPDIAFPMTTVTVTQPGASPSQLEAGVTRKIEDSVATVTNVKRVMSTVSEGVSTTTIEFQLEADLATALDDTRDAVTRIRTDLPQDIQEPVISKVDIGGSLMTYALVAPKMTPDEASWFVDREVARAMYGVPGVARVTRVGGVQRQVRVDLDPNALLAFGITAGDVSKQLAQIQVERAGGKAELGGAQQTIRTLGTVADAQALRDFSISLPDGRAARLSTLARITDAAADPAEAALLDGRDVVAFSMSRTRGSSEVKVEAGVHQALADIKAAHPGIDFRLVTTAIDETHRSYASSMTMLYEGAALALLVVWLFLRNWRATWVSALALPLSIIPTFAVMHMFGFTLNMITLLALSVVVGILVDDAIVEIENIVRHLRMGKPLLEAARDAAGEIGNAVIATSLTLAAVFVPVAFMPGIAGKFFREFGWTAATAVLFSLLVARLLTPMMAAYLLKPHGEEQADSRLMRWYLGWVDATLRHRARTLWIATGLFAASLALVPLIPATFIPQSDLGRSNLNLELPPGTRLQDTVAVAARARALLKDIPELKQIYTAVGSVLDLGDPNATGVGEARKATLVLDWGVADHRERDQRVLEREARAPGRHARRARELRQFGTRKSAAAGPGRRRPAAPAGCRHRAGTRPARHRRAGQRQLHRIAAAARDPDRPRSRAGRGHGRGHGQHRRGRAHRDCWRLRTAPGQAQSARPPGSDPGRLRRIHPRQPGHDRPTARAGSLRAGAAGRGGGDPHGQRPVADLALPAPAQRHSHRRTQRPPPWAR